ncbi:MoxR family ATPase [Streptomyces sp. CAU 1734]|uniref:AAA family ATPase n=1 Tax=Streptomyces sp. CAU 1734 TaxID=3140360 RepID=UPI0032617065
MHPDDGLAREGRSPGDGGAEPFAAPFPESAAGLVKGVAGGPPGPQPEAGAEAEAEDARPSWWIYQGTGRPLTGASLGELLPPPPPWRRFQGTPVLPPPPSDDEEIERRLGRFAQLTTTSRQARREADMVNAALHLRRPLLVTGRPGTGKSALAYRISRELRLGRVLRWHITSRTTLRAGLYEYDAIGRVQDSAALRAREPEAGPPQSAGLTPNGRTVNGGSGPPAGYTAPGAGDPLPGIGDYVQLGPLGTALLAHEAPRILLIDELDKSDQDLANDLLSVFEEGQFAVPELVRVRRREPRVTVMTDDPHGSADVVGGVVHCRAFPIVVITSNGEREFPPAFLRRCLRLRMPDPDRSQLVDMVAAHLTRSAVSGPGTEDLITRFLQRSRERGGLAVDQLLNSVFLATSGRLTEGPEEYGPGGDGTVGDRQEALQELVEALWHRLDGAEEEAGPG